MEMDRRDFIRYFAGAAAFGAAWTTGFLDGAFADPPILDSSFKYYCPELAEITTPGPVIPPDGTCKCGWTRRPIMELNFEDAKFSTRQKMNKAMKKWDMYHIYTPEHSMQFLVSWIPYAAFFNANIYVRKTNMLYEDTRFLPAKPEIPMMRDSSGGRTVFEADKVKVVFDVNGEHHKISVDFDGFAMVDKTKADLNLSGGDTARTNYKFEADLLYPKDHESIASVNPGDPKRCHYGNKINCMTIDGSVTFNGVTTKMTRDSSFGALDFGRGHYPNKMFWYWATASGRADDGKLIGFNLGYANSPTNIAENAIFYDGKLTKVNAVSCVVPPDTNLMNPWIVRDKDGLVDLTYKPLKVRSIDTKLGSMYSVGRPSLGLYSGKLITSSGKTIVLKDLFGLYEWSNSNW